MLRTIRFFLSSRKSWTIPYVIFSAVFVILPLLLIVVYAFMDDAGHFTLGNFAKFFAHPEAINTFVYSIGVAIITTVVCILLGYPAAYILTQMRMKYASTVVVLFILPMWVNILIRTLATVALFDFMNVSLGEGALIFGMVYNFLPFMIYPIYNTLQKLDKSYVEAAQDLGANPMQVFFKAVLPLSMPGIVSGILMVFMPTISTFAIAELLTMNNIKLFGTTIQENINNSMWNYGAALSLIMTKEVDYGKENFVSGVFVAASAIALCAYFYHYDLFVYRSKGAGQLDRVFHQTLFIPICCGYTSFIDKCLGQYLEHCLYCSYRIHLAGQYYGNRHIQSSSPCP